MLDDAQRGCAGEAATNRVFEAHVGRAHTSATAAAPQAASVIQIVRANVFE
jgi:hypothetical protein